MERNGVEIARYTYDLNGNRLTHETPAGTTTATYDAQDRLTASGAATYTYTADGELATKTDASGTTTYAYDVLGSLRAVALPDGTAIAYLIDGQNHRVGRMVDGLLTAAYPWEDELRVSAVLDATGAVVARFVYGTQVNVPEYVVTDPGTAERRRTGCSRMNWDRRGSPSTRATEPSHSGWTTTNLAASFSTQIPASSPSGSPVACTIETPD